MALAIDFFSGVGGLSLGLEQAGFEVGLSVEIEEITGKYAQYNSPLTKVLYGSTDGDIKNFTSDNVHLKKAINTHGEVTLIAGGPPCQGFSLAGKKNDEDPLNDLILEFARVIVDVMPRVFLIENVPGIKIGGSEKLRQTIDILQNYYHITEPTTLNAWDFGVPQTRKRVFILGYRKDLQIKPSLPSPTHCPSNNKNKDFFLRRTPSCWDAISDVPDCDQYPQLLSEDRVPFAIEPQNDYQFIMRGLKKENDDFSYQVDWNKEICTNIRRTQHGIDLLERFSLLAPGKSDKKSAIRRLVADDLSTTIRAGTTKDRGSWSAPRPLHPFLNRVITTRECARIQSFPDSWTFHPTKWNGNRMVGNAVPPLLAKAIGKHIISELNLTTTNKSKVIVSRVANNIAGDLIRAKASRYEDRKVSQHVASWSVKK
jgi:DNA (cytosine-5)-methyltransferase 1